MKRNCTPGSKLGLVDARELAAALGIPRTEVYRLANMGRIPHFRVGRYLRFELDEVLAVCRKRVQEGVER